MKKFLGLSISLFLALASSMPSVFAKGPASILMWDVRFLNSHSYLDLWVAGGNSITKTDLSFEIDPGDKTSPTDSDVTFQVIPVAKIKVTDNRSEMGNLDDFTRLSFSFEEIGVPSHVRTASVSVQNPHALHGKLMEFWGNFANSGESLRELPKENDLMEYVFQYAIPHYANNRVDSISEDLKNSETGEEIKKISNTYYIAKTKFENLIKLARIGGLRLIGR
jgi:hypothetical protein